MLPGGVSDADTLSRSRGRGPAQFYGQPLRAAPEQPSARSRRRPRLSDRGRGQV